MHIFLDESGDVGFGAGGTRHITITFIATLYPNKIRTTVKRVERKVVKSFGWNPKKELKCYDASELVRELMLRKLMKQDFEIHTAVCKKSDVYVSLQKRQSELYNYLAGQIVVPFVARYRDVEMFYDIRSKKVFAEKQLEGYLRTTVFYFVENSNTRNFNIRGVQSDVQPGIRAVDFVAWAIQRRHEVADTSFYDIVAQKIVTELIGPEVFCRRY